MNQQAAPVTIGKLLRFFVPLGLSAALINLSHVIINGTLARADHPEIVLAGYAVAMSIMALVERPGVLFRQTCSALVRDRVSFRAVRRVSYYVFGSSVLFGGLLAWTPVGVWIFGGAFRAEGEVMRGAIHAYAALMFVSVFSGIRCLFQGVLITHMQTRWLTIGMIVRVSGMFALSQLFLYMGVYSAIQGAAIFLFGMMIEAFVSWRATAGILRRLPEREPDCETRTPRQVMRFYSPLLMSTLIVVWLLPIINTLLGATEQGTLAVASFAIGGTLANLMIGFFSYFHQIALQFVKRDPATVRRFMLLLGFIPALLMLLLSFTPLGPWMLRVVLGVHGELLTAGLHALRGYLLFVLVFPWLDALNGLVMASANTKLMLGSQLANAIATTASIIILALSLPHWAGSLGSLALSVGLAAELSVLSLLYIRYRKVARKTTSMIRTGV